jgi:hypothetical protein
MALSSDGGAAEASVASQLYERLRRVTEGSQLQVAVVDVLEGYFIRYPWTSLSLLLYGCLTYLPTNRPTHLQVHGHPRLFLRDDASGSPHAAGERPSNYTITHAHRSPSMQQVRCPPTTPQRTDCVRQTL